jgi:hypothetical protein
VKTVWTITTNAVSGTPELFGVYEDAGACALAFEHITQCCNDVDDQYRIKHSVVEEYTDLVEQFEQCNKERLEAIAKEEANVTD